MSTHLIILHIYVLRLYCTFTSHIHDTYEVKVISGGIVNGPVLGKLPKV